MCIKLYSIRETPDKKGSILSNVLYLLFVFFLGITMGLMAEYFDYYSSNAVIGSFLSSEIGRGFSRVGNMFSIWIFTAALIAAYSRTPVAAGINSFAFFTAMNISYFLYESYHYGLSYNKQLYFWMLIAVLSIFAAMIMWYSRGKGWFAAFIAASPIAAVLAEMLVLIITFIDRQKYVHGSRTNIIFSSEAITTYLIYALFTSVLFIFLPNRKSQRLRTGLVSVGLCPVFYFAYALLFNLL